MPSARRRYLEELQATLPAGAEVLLTSADGVAQLVRSTGVEHLDPARNAGFLPFIDAGHFTRYLVGAADTSDLNPSNATYKLGVVAAHRGFTPHAHGAEHFVFSTGYAACGLYDAQRDRVASVRLGPGALLHIPALMPHTFHNRAHSPLLLLVTNTGMGIDHEDYAITAAQAAARAHHHGEHTHDHADQADSSQSIDYAQLAGVLHRLERELPLLAGHHRLRLRERLAARLRMLAARLER
jgi:mannose-6-phosphate isomerase-like protein (cupin superfamily)